MRAPAMRMRRKAIPTTMPRTHRTITMITVITMTITTMTSIAITTIITAIPMLMTTSKPKAKPPRRAAARAGETSKDPVQPIEHRKGMDEAEAAALYRLMTWLSPAFPVGAFSYSSGIEWAVEAGDIGDAASLRDWLSSVLADGPGFCDGVFLAHAHRATASRDDLALRDIAELASAFVPSRERHLETSAQGRAFIDIARAAWSRDGLDGMIACCDGAIVYPVAVGLVSAAHAIPLPPTMHAFLHALTSNWISAGARLIPLGQTDSQRVLASLEPVVVATAKRALEAALGDLGGASFRADLASMRHETQYTRLFRS
jgi:urease accessory protein